MGNLPIAVQEAIANHYREELAAACELARVGARTVQSRDRTADTARRRAVVAWVLADTLHWSQRQIARELGISVRGVEEMLRKMRVSVVRTHTNSGVGMAPQSVTRPSRGRGKDRTNDKQRLRRTADSHDATRRVRDAGTVRCAV